MATTPFFDNITNQVGGLVIRTSASAGYDTIGIDHLRQGVEIRNDRDRYGGNLKISAGTTDHELEHVVIGQALPYLEGYSFAEMERMVPCLVLSGATNLSQTELDSNILDEFQLNGVLEPFNIRDVAALSSIEGNRPAHAIKGHLQSGNENPLDGSTDVITQFVELKPPPIETGYLESNSNFSSEFVSGSATIVVPGPFLPIEQIINPYSDTARLRPALLTTSSMSRAMIKVLSSGSQNSVANELLPLGHNSSGAGWTFENMPFGTDSIAFGGLKQ